MLWLLCVLPRFKILCFRRFLIRNHRLLRVTPRARHAHPEGQPPRRDATPFTAIDHQLVPGHRERRVARALLGQQLDDALLRRASSRRSRQ